MIEGNGSMINLLNDECKRPKGNDLELQRAFNTMFAKNQFYGTLFPIILFQTLIIKAKKKKCKMPLRSITTRKQ